MKCGKCHGWFEKEGRDPLLLPSCGHTLCRSCLRLFIQHNGFKCPFCGMKQAKVSLTELLPNYALLAVIESMNEENGRNGKKRDRYRSRGRGAAGDRSRDESTHTIRINECVDHEGVRLTYWCGPCGVAACGECVVEKHSGGTGGRKHQVTKIDVALKTRRSEMENLVYEVMSIMDAAEKKRTNLAQFSPFIAGAKKLQTEVNAVMGKMKIVASLISCLIQESEDGNTGLLQLRQEMENLIQKAPPSASTTAGVAEIRALLEHLKCIEKFRDGPVAKVLKEADALGKEDRQNSLLSATDYTAALNVKAATLCRQVLCCGDGCYLEVVGSAGLVGSLTWTENKLHLHCLRRPSPTDPRKPPSDPARRHGLKWPVIQTQMNECTQVFLVLARGVQGQAGAGKEHIFLKLYHPDSNASCSSTNETACRRFLHLIMGDEDCDGKNTLLGSIIDVQEVAGARAILLGTHQQKEGEGEEKKSKEGVKEETTSKADSHPVSSGSSPVTLAAGDVMCVKGWHSEGEAEFWLVTEGAARTMKPPATCEVVGALSHANKSLLARLPSLRGMRVEDCGVILCSESEVLAPASPAAPAPSARKKNGRSGKKRGRHRSKSTAGTGEDKDRGRDESTHTRKENECVEHEGMRLTYWCGRCGVVACAKCVAKKHSGDTGGKRHQTVRINAAPMKRRTNLEDFVFEIVHALVAGLAQAGLMPQIAEAGDAGVESKP